MILERRNKSRSLYETLILLLSDSASHATVQMYLERADDSCLSQAANLSLKRRCAMCTNPIPTLINLKKFIKQRDSTYKEKHLRAGPPEINNWWVPRKAGLVKMFFEFSLNNLNTLMKNICLLWEALAVHFAERSNVLAQRVSRQIMSTSHKFSGTHM